MNVKVGVMITVVSGMFGWAIVSSLIMGATPFSDVIAFEARCGTEATQIRALAQGRQEWVKGQNPSATVVYFGGSEVDTRGAYPVCNDTRSCADASLAIRANLTLYCRAALGTVNIRCITGR